MIVGVDEVGRGAWAGPLVVGAVVLGDHTIEGLTDSKKLTAKKRQVLAKQIKEQAAGIGLGWIAAETIDRYGLTKCLQLATQKALVEITAPYEQIIIDGTFNFLGDARVATMKQADLLVPSVSAASIIAKVARDYYMTTKLHEELPHYAFDKHVGYGTAAHATSLREHGPSDAHRLSFSPVKKALGLDDIVTEFQVDKIETTQGRKAEKLVARHLESLGFKVIGQNWRTKVCEIDIVAQKDGIVYCVEVKYRQGADHGDGIAAITPKKLAKMKFAARVWQQFNGSHDTDIQLMAVSVSGETMQIDEFLELTE